MASPLLFWTPHWSGAVCPVFLFHRIQITVKRNIHWYTLNNTLAFATLTPSFKASIKESLRLYLKYYCEKLMQEPRYPVCDFLWKTKFPFCLTASKVTCKYQRPLGTARAQIWTPCKCLVNHCRDKSSPWRKAKGELSYSSKLSSVVPPFSSSILYAGLCSSRAQWPLAHGMAWRLTFALGRLENLRFFIQICWAP